MERLALLKALGDNTRYAIYLEIARSAAPLSTSDIADSLGLHPNTVRPHLERMRDVGLLDVEIDARGTVGRPQHRYCLAADAPSLGLEPPAFPALARMLAQVAATAGPARDEIIEAGRAQGRRHGIGVVGDDGAATGDTAGPERTSAEHCAAALIRQMANLGFDPAAGGDAVGGMTLAFTHCPYRELAEVYPELVCHLHRGMIEGFVEGFAERDAELREGGAQRPGEYAGPSARLAVDEFHTLVDRDPCQVSLSAVAPPGQIR